MKLPRLEAEAELGELGEAFTEFRIARQVRRHYSRGEFADRFARVLREPVTDAAETSAAEGDLGFQHIAHPRAEREVGMADDRLRDTAGTVVAGCAHGSDAVDELDLANRRHLR